MHLLEPGTAYSPGKQELQTDMPELLASELFPPEFSFSKIESGKVAEFPTWTVLADVAAL
jgi:hypothetical protein